MVLGSLALPQSDAENITPLPMVQQCNAVIRSKDFAIRRSNQHETTLMQDWTTQCQTHTAKFFSENRHRPFTSKKHPRKTKRFCQSSLSLLFPTLSPLFPTEPKIQICSNRKSPIPHAETRNTGVNTVTVLTKVKEFRFNLSTSRHHHPMPFRQQCHR